MADTWLAAAGLLAVFSAAASRRIDRLPLTEPLIALVVGVVFGPRVLGILDVSQGDPAQALSLVARLTLAVSLMAIALRYPIGEVLDRRRSVGWLLLVVLPGMAAIGASLTALVLGTTLGVALVVGTALAPTDPVLASSVISGEPAQRTLPSELRQQLSLESGANDGLAFPFVLVAVAVATGTSTSAALLTALWSVAGAIGIGGLLGWTVARILLWAEQHGDVEPSREAMSSLLLALGVLGLAGLARADGLLAVFVTGLAYNAATTGREREAEERIDEAVNRFLVLPLFVLVGVLLPWAVWAELGWRGPVFVVALLLLRRLPLIVLLRRPLRARRLRDSLWLGWFGPIGGAAVYYLTHVEDLGVDEPLVWGVGSMVVAASTILHGVTATPLRIWYGRASSSDQGP